MALGRPWVVVVVWLWWHGVTEGFLMELLYFFRNMDEIVSDSCGIHFLQHRTLRMDFVGNKFKE